MEQATSVQSHVLGLKFTAKLCSLTALSPPPVRVQIPPVWGAAGAAWGHEATWGLSPRLYPITSSQKLAGANGDDVLERGPLTAIRAPGEANLTFTSALPFPS